MSEPGTTDVADELRQWAATCSPADARGDLAEKAADEIGRLRGLLMEVMSAPEAAYHGDWFARATEALPDAID